MSGGGITEGVGEQAALDWFRSLGYATLPGAVLAPGGIAPERTSYDQVVLTGRLRDAALRINADLPVTVVEQAMTRSSSKPSCSRRTGRCVPGPRRVGRRRAPMPGPFDVPACG